MDNAQQLQLTNYSHNIVQLGNSIPPEPTADQVDEREDYDAQEAFSAAQHSTAFASVDAQEDNEREIRLVFLSELKESDLAVTVTFGVSQSQSRTCPAFKLAKASAVFYVKVRLYKEQQKVNPLTFDLSQFEDETVDEFITAVELSTQVYDEENDVAFELQEDTLIELARISHFMSFSILYVTCSVKIIENIDANNAISIMLLADTLADSQMHSASLKSVMFKTGQTTVEDSEFWDDVPDFLKMRITTLRNAVKSSLVGRGNETQLFFTDVREFLGIFEENIQDQVERLVEAKESQERLMLERDGEGVSEAMVYAGRMIENQEKRIDCLKVFFKEQEMKMKEYATVRGGRQLIRNVE